VANHGSGKLATPVKSGLAEGNRSRDLLRAQVEADIQRSAKVRPGRITVLAVLAAVVAALGFLLWEGSRHSLDYFYPAAQAVANRAQLSTHPFQIEGNVVPGTIARRDGALTFSISSGGVVVPVVFKGPVPPLFQPGMAVVILGHFAKGSGPGGTALLFMGDQMLLKHSATYIAEHPDRFKATPSSH
jgi:cytochrome c-type biogenesis protein CcmE